MSARKLTAEQVRDLAAHLRGSCGTLEGALLSLFGIEEDDLTVPDNEAIDDEIFCCDRCNWWCGTEEMSEHGWYCDECADEDDEESEE